MGLKPNCTVCVSCNRGMTVGFLVKWNLIRSDLIDWTTQTLRVVPVLY